MNKDLLIIGGSPFVNTIELPRINTNKFDILAINRQPLNIRTKFLIAYDDDFRACHTQEEVRNVKEQGLNPVFIAPKTEFIHKTTGWEFKRDYINTDKSKKILGFCLYTCSSAVNFAYLKGYKSIYLIGIDLKEDNKPFSHWHGITNIKNVPSSSARMAKQYLYRYKNMLNMYQVNPEVADIWDIPYYKKEKLYC